MAPNVTQNKRSRNTINHSYLLPEEIVEQILVRIPSTKTIVRCTSVCKSWYFLIKSSVFIRSHLFSPNKTKYLLCATRFNFCEGLCYSIYNDTIPISHEAYKLLLPNKVKGIQLHGCCDGVICYTKLRKNRETTYLYNPSIRKLKKLPEFRNPQYPSKAIGFWFNTQTNNYEVARMCSSSKATRVHISVDVFSLCSNSWRIVSENSWPAPFWVSDDLVHTNGRLHWLATKSPDDRVIVSLDMSCGKFQETKMSWSSTPNFLFKGMDDRFLAIFTREGRGSDRPYLIKVYDSMTLNILYTVGSGLVGGPPYQVGFRNNGETLFVRRISIPTEILLYNIDTKICKLSSSLGDLHWVRPFVESLVLLDS